MVIDNFVSFFYLILIELKQQYNNNTNSVH